MSISSLFIYFLIITTYSEIGGGGPSAGSSEQAESVGTSPPNIVISEQ